MQLPIKKNTITTYIRSHEDSEWIGEDECVLDLYELDPPISLDLTFCPDGTLIEGAFALGYDEGLDGWFLQRELTDLEEIRSALEKAGLLS